MCGLPDSMYVHEAICQEAQKVVVCWSSCLQLGAEPNWIVPIACCDIGLDTMAVTHDGRSCRSWQACRSWQKHA